LATWKKASITQTCAGTFVVILLRIPHKCWQQGLYIPPSPVSPPHRASAEED
jgi:hypothetical protein